MLQPHLLYSWPHWWSHLGMPQAKVRHAPLRFPLETVPLLFLQTRWVVLPTEDKWRHEVRGKGYDAYSTTFQQFPLTSVRGSVMNRNGGATSEEAACLSPRNDSWSVTWLFSFIGHTTEMLKKAAHTPPDKNRQLWGRVLPMKTTQRTVRRRHKYSLITSQYPGETAQGNRLVATDSQGYWTSKQVRPLAGNLSTAAFMAYIFFKEQRWNLKILLEASWYAHFLYHTQIFLEYLQWHETYYSRFGKPCQKNALDYVSLLLPITGPGSTLRKKSKIPHRHHNPQKYLESTITYTFSCVIPANAD